MEKALKRTDVKKTFGLTKQGMPEVARMCRERNKYPGGGPGREVTGRG